MEFGATSSHRLRRLAFVVVACLITFGVAFAILTRPTRNPDQLWLSVQEDLKAGRFDRAKESMDQLLRLRPPGDDQWLVLGQLAMAHGRDSEAIDHLAHVSDGHPRAARARTWEGAIELRKKRARKAEVALLRAVGLDPDDPAPRRQLIALYCMQRRRRELSEQFAALSRRTALGFSDMVLWGSSLAASWDPSEVQAALEGFVKADPDDRTSRLVLAEALRRLRRPDDVEVVLNCLPPFDPEVRAIRARIAETRGDGAEIERLTSDHPEEHPVLARMRASLDLSRRDLAAARKHLRAALAADPHNRSVLFQLGDTLTRSGDVEEGRRYVAAARAHDYLYDLFERLTEPGGRNDAGLLGQIAKTSLDLGLRDEARGWYLLALELDPSNQEIQKGVYRLEHEKAPNAAESPVREVPQSSRELAMPTTLAE
jgi:tetratricopeptide (TPR) repeat protein